MVRLSDKCSQGQGGGLPTHIHVGEGFQEGILLLHDARGRIPQGVAAETHVVPGVWYGTGPGFHEETPVDIAWVDHKVRDRGLGSGKWRERERGGWSQR